jgi:hypothetical protein
LISLQNAPKAGASKCQRICLEWMRLEIGFNWHKSCVDENQPSTIFWLQPISGTSHEIFIPGRDEKNMKKTGISLETCHCSFQWRTALKKESKVGPQP